MNSITQSSPNVISARAQWRLHLQIKITEAISRLAPDLPLKFSHVDTTETDGRTFKKWIVYTGITFNFEIGEVKSAFLKDADHYIKYVLPTVINAQRLLQKRKDEKNGENVLIEGPLARLMMDQFGEKWVGEAHSIINSASGKKYNADGWTAKLIQGVLRGKIKLSPEAEWKNGELYIEPKLSPEAQWKNGEIRLEPKLPASVIASLEGSSLQGRAISDIVDHPIFGTETKIKSCRIFECEKWVKGKGMIIKRSLIISVNTPNLRIDDFNFPLVKAA